MAGYTHTCAHCGTEMSVHERYLGRTLRCTGCRAQFLADPEAARAETPARLPESVRHICTACGTEMTVARRYYGRSLRCTECGEEFTARLPVVDPPLPEDPGPGESVIEPQVDTSGAGDRRSPMPALVAGAAAVAVLALVLWYLGGDRSEGWGSSLFRTEKARTQIGTLHLGDAQRVPVALSRQGVESLLGLAASDRTAVPDQLVRSPGYVSVAAGTRVRVLQRRRGAEAKVRILDGPQNSRIVWIPAAWVR
jgi:DNA-directed RNA polymerase subunit RPC12/RpoP